MMANYADLVREGDAGRQSGQWKQHASSLIICGVLGLALFYNMVLRWAPWPTGFSLNNFTTLAQNQTGIAVSIALELVLLVASLAVISRTRRSAVVLLVPFLVFLGVSPFFRPNIAGEAVRTFAFLALFGSALAVSTVFVSSTVSRGALLRAASLAVLAAYTCGAMIAFGRPGSVRLGSFLIRGDNDRGEFFFFFIPPHLVLALVVAYLISRRASRLSWFGFCAGYFLIFALALRTHTRTYIIGLLGLAALLIMMRIGARAAIGVAVAGIVVLFAIGAFPLLARELRLDQFGQAGVDATNGRSGLVSVVLDSFESNPGIGPGAAQMRETVQSTDLKAKTEYGVLGYLGSFGLAASPLFAVLGLSWGVSAVRIFRRAVGPRRRLSELAAFDAINLANMPLTLFWLLGSATSFYDWLTLFVSFVALQATVVRRKWEPVSNVQPGGRVSPIPSAHAATVSGESSATS